MNDGAMLSAPAYAARLGFTSDARWSRAAFQRGFDRVRFLTSPRTARVAEMKGEEQSDWRKNRRTRVSTLKTQQ